MKILITRPLAQAHEFAEKLRSAGFEPVFFPVIEIQPVDEYATLDMALERLSCYEWVVFTSVNAVDVVIDRIPAALHIEELSVKVAAIGPKTAGALQVRGITPDFVPEEYIAEAILPGLGDVRGKWILLPRAEIARKALPEAIFEAGGIPHEIAVYKTLPARPDPEGLAALRSGVDVITLTSPSTARNFVELARQDGLDPLRLPNNPIYACIGPITGQAAKEEGLANRVVAESYTTEGLIDVISKWRHHDSV